METGQESRGYVWRLKTVIATVAGNADLRRVESGVVLFNLAEMATWIAVLVFAYRRGGATEAGLATVVLVVPAAILAPLLAQFGDRHPRRSVLIAGFIAQAVTMAATALVMRLQAPGAIVYPVAATATAALAVTRPTVAAMLPDVVRTPDELTAANVLTGWIASLGFFAGPALGGVLLTVGGPSLVYAAGAVLTAAGAAAAAGIRGARVAAAASGSQDLVRGSLEGLRIAATDPSVRVLVGLGGAMSVLLGTLDILFVVIAFALLHMGEGGPGALSSLSGLGGVIGGAATILLVGRPRLSPPLVSGIVVFGGALSLVGFASVVPAMALLAVSGAGWSVADVAGRTLLQRVSREDVLARLFGVLEGMEMASFAIGAIVASALVAWLGARWAVVVAGATMPVLAAVSLRRLRAVDRSAAVPARTIALLRAVTLFAYLPPPEIERLAKDVMHVTVPAGTQIVRQGAAGDRFYAIVEGTATVIKDGVVVNELGPGDHFGEIALLRDVPRQAGVTASSALTALALGRGPFLEAVTGHPQTLQAASEAMDRLVGPDDPESNS